MTRRLLSDTNGEDDLLDHAALTEHERSGLPAAYYYADQHDFASPADKGYRRQLVNARRSILERLLGGLARDAPAGIPEPVVVSIDGATKAAVDTVPGADDVATLVERVPDSGEAEQLLVIRFPAVTASVVAPVVTSGPYGRFRFGKWAVICRPDEVNPVGSPEAVVRLLEREEAFPTADDADRFRLEVGKSVANLALARLGQHTLWSHLDQTPVPTADRPRPAADTGAFFDRLVTGGHPIHPGAKLRRNMSPTELLSFTPEFTDSISLRFVAVHRTRTLSVSADERAISEWLYDLFPGLASAVEQSLPAGRDRSNYIVLPVHPWQFRHVVPARYAQACRKGHVVPIVDYSRSATPLLSLRTVVPDADETSRTTPPHLKLAIGVQTTNAVRTLSPSVVANGPPLGEFIRQRCEIESFDRFGVCTEPVAACYHPPDGPHFDGEGYDDARHLGALIRRHPATHSIVADCEQAVTAASILSCPPPDDQSVLAALLDTTATNMITADRSETVKTFLEAYLDAVIPGPLTLLVKQGIALEAHLQNTAIVFNDGRPTGALCSDFGDISLCTPRVGDIDFDLYPESEICTADPQPAREKLWYSLFQNHLGELIGRLVATEPVEADDCWSLVRERCEQVFDRLAAERSVPDARVSADRESLFAPRLVHKPLTAMRMAGSNGGQPHTTVPNPLSEMTPKQTTFQ
ncbi:IucA/IucC family siderophore biosynthesis protein [Haloarcula sp. CBA1127]|uniref:IucA/IucC family protein n=1 Tax=Haloarcula sp. CBA1127 TaxID=1765055 RepID=UPI00073E5CA6|nr:IucA/IucC family protein [Haloarcula sp. CBA1127]